MSNTSRDQHRDLDATLLTMDLNLLTDQIKNEDAYLQGDRNAITIFKNQQMRIVLVALQQGTEMKTHTAPGIISVQVLEGQIEFTADGSAVERTAGQALVLHTGIPHSVKALQPSVFLLTMSIAN
ncbi:cupin domain-containing protein [Pedobacter faecalis]|uniref:cupin domain-containing protein n=1 Tax=Pedobacter faecalis TaxID=3041495 RepID=UPI00254FCF96|nr:cupin domain-containing protein [Pedobacter sp. ELA7]